MLIRALHFSVVRVIAAEALSTVDIQIKASRRTGKDVVVASRQFDLHGLMTTKGRYEYIRLATADLCLYSLHRACRQTLTLDKADKYQQKGASANQDTKIEIELLCDTIIAEQKPMFERS